MDNVLPFPDVTPDMRIGYRGPASNSSTKEDVENSFAKEYLELAKRTLPKYDYESVLLSIMDTEYYEKSDILVRTAVKDYFKIISDTE